VQVLQGLDQDEVVAADVLGDFGVQPEDLHDGLGFHVGIVEVARNEPAGRAHVTVFGVVGTHLVGGIDEHCLPALLEEVGLDGGEDLLGCEAHAGTVKVRLWVLATPRRWSGQVVNRRWTLALTQFR
jgi:hypothetical protein